MPGDLEYIATLNDRDFQRGINSINRAAQGSAERQKEWGRVIEKGFGGLAGLGAKVGIGFAGAVGALRLARKAIGEIIEDTKTFEAANPFAVDRISAWTAAVTQAKLATGQLGSTIKSTVLNGPAPFTGSGPGSAKTIGQTVTGLWTSAATNWTKIILGKDAYAEQQSAVEQARIQSMSEAMLPLKRRIDLQDAQRRGDTARQRSIETAMMRDEMFRQLPPGDSPEKRALEARIANEPLPYAGSLGLRPGMGRAFGGAFNARGSIADAVAAGRWGDAPWGVSGAAGRMSDVFNYIGSGSAGGSGPHYGGGRWAWPAGGFNRPRGPSSGNTIYAGSATGDGSTMFDMSKDELFQNNTKVFDDKTGKVITAQNERVIELLDKVERNTRESGARFE